MLEKYKDRMQNEIYNLYDTSWALIGASPIAKTMIEFTSYALKTIFDWRIPVNYGCDLMKMQEHWMYIAVPIDAGLNRAWAGWL